MQLNETTVAMLGKLARGGHLYLWFKNETSGPSRTVWYDQGVVPTTITAADTEHVYFGVYPTSSTKTSAERAKVADISALNCLYAEYDGEKTYDEIMALSFKPSCVIESSPGKYHAYWFLTETITVSDGNRFYYQNLIAKWVQFVGGDKASKDMARVLRLPGSRNVKAKYQQDDGSYPEVRMLWYDDSIAYDEPAVMGVFATTDSKARKLAATKPLDGLTQAALAAITSERWGEYDTWLKIGMALHSDGFGCEVWDTYSQQAPNYTPGVCEAKWGTFKVGGGGAATVGIGTLHQIASECNENWKREYYRGAVGQDVPDYILMHEHLVGAYTALCEAGLTVRWNMLSEQIEQTGLHSENSQAAYDVLKSDGVPRGEREATLESIAKTFSYHPMKEYFEQLPVPDTPGAVVDLVLSSIHTNSSELDRAILKKWLVGIVARLYDNTHQNFCPVLYGKPAIGKSRFINWLTPQHDWLTTAPLRAHDKDTHIRLNTFLLWHLDEMDKLMSRQLMSELKALITSETTNERRAYARNFKTRYNITSFIGSTNQSDILTDLTGNRRYLVMTVKSVDWDTYEAVDKDEFWSDVFALYQSGFDARLTKEEEQHRDNQNAHHMVEDDLMLHLQEVITPCADGFIKNTDLLNYCQAVTRSNSNYTGKLVKERMARLGYDQVRVSRGGKTVRGYSGCKLDI